jgi:hypothetical protein
VIQAAESAHSIPLRSEFFFDRNTSYKLSFSRWREALFVPNGPIHISSRNTCSTKRKPSILQNSACTSLFTCEKISKFLKAILPAT